MADLIGSQRRGSSIAALSCVAIAERAAALAGEQPEVSVRPVNGYAVSDRPAGFGLPPPVLELPNPAWSG